MNSVWLTLDAMKVDACSAAFKKCLQADDRCGSDYANCIGLDLPSVAQMCPIEKLVACNSDGKKLEGTVYTNDSLMSILQGIFLNVDNAFADECRANAEAKMIELCGDTNTCDAFDDDNLMGTESLLSYTSGNDYVVDGLMTFSNLEVKKTETSTTDANGEPITTTKIGLDAKDYINSLANVDANTKNRIEGAINGVNNKVEQKLAVLRSDSKISLCINGRDMSNIRKSKDDTTDMTKARFPNLLSAYEEVIVNSALDQAKTNYDKKFNELLANATASQSQEIKAAMCASLAMNADDEDKDEDGKSVNVIDSLFSNVGKSGKGTYGSTKITISGIAMADLAKIQASGKGEWIFTDQNQGSDKSAAMLGQMIKTAVFNPTTSVCTITTETKSCKNVEKVYETTTKNTKARIALFFKRKRKVEKSTFTGTVCTEFSETETSTQTIKM